MQDLENNCVCMCADAHPHICDPAIPFVVQENQKHVMD